jgi:hypothetical protein
MGLLAGGENAASAAAPRKSLCSRKGSGGRLASGRLVELFVEEFRELVGDLLAAVGADRRKAALDARHSEPPHRKGDDHGGAREPERLRKRG